MEEVVFFFARRAETADSTANQRGKAGCNQYGRQVTADVTQMGQNVLHVFSLWLLCFSEEAALSLNHKAGPFEDELRLTGNCLIDHLAVDRTYALTVDDENMASFAPHPAGIFPPKSICDAILDAFLSQLRALV